MGGQVEVWPPSPNIAPPLYIPKDDNHWTHFDNSVNAVSFGFVATAVLISMFLVMAVFEKFLRTNPLDMPPEGERRLRADVEAGGVSSTKLVGYTSPKIPAKAREVSVLMPGDDIPRFIANPAPIPCPPKHKPWPLHEQSYIANGSSSSSRTTQQN